MEGKGYQEANAVKKFEVTPTLFNHCYSLKHQTKTCLPLSTPYGSQVNYVDQYKAPPLWNNNTYRNNYNPSWGNHPNLSWKQNHGQPQGKHQINQTTHSSNPIENDITDLTNG